MKAEEICGGMSFDKALLIEKVIEAAEALSDYWASGGPRDENEEQRLFDAVLDTTAALQAVKGE